MSRQAKISQASLNGANQFRASKSDSTGKNQTTRNCRCSKSNPVLMATEVNAEDQDEQKIIWPKEYVGKEMTVILLNDYGPQKNK